MHFFAFAILAHTLVVAVIAFFVLFAASKADGFVRLLGTVLGWIILIVAILSLLTGIYHVATGKGPIMGDRWMMRMQSEPDTATPQSSQPKAH